MTDEQADNKPQVSAPKATEPRLKNPKRVEAGKLNAEKTRKAREAQKKALADAEAKIANCEANKKDSPEPDAGTTVNAVPPPPLPPKESVYWGFSTTQWLMIAGTLVSLLGIYAKREEISAAHAKLFKAGTTVCTPAPEVGTTAVTPSPNVDTTAPKARRAPAISKMD